MYNFTIDDATINPQAGSASSGDDGPSAYTIIFEYIFPWVGVIIGNMMYSAPWKDVLDASLTGDLGVLNPLPWAFMTGNCFGWLVYGMLKNDLSIVSGSAPGLLLSIWLNMQAVKLQYARSYSQEMRKLLIKNNNLEGQDIEINHNGNNTLSHRRRSSAYLDDRSLTDIDEEKSIQGTDLGLLHHQRSPNNLHKSSHQRHEQSLSTISPLHRPSHPLSNTSNTNTGGLRIEQAFTSPDTDFDLLVLNVHSSMQKIKTTSNQETVLLVVCFIWVMIILCLAFIPHVSRDVSTNVVGIAVNLNLVIFYGAPLSTIYTVVTTGVSASIHKPTMILNSINGGLWGVYGLVVSDPYVIIPNMSGLALGIVQGTLCLLYPRELPVDPKSVDGSTNRRTIVMISSQKLNDMESLSVLSLVNQSKRRSTSNHGSTVNILTDPSLFQGKIERLWL